jgi:glycosyltransferase involved in cell wall biosynthesis
VVSFDLVETRVSAGEASLYAAGNDAKDFGDKIAALLDDPELRKRLGGIGKARIAERLSWDHSKKALYRAYRMAFDKAGKGRLAPPGGADTSKTRSA